MKLYYLGEDGKPCIWPVPNDCIWNGERYKAGNSLKVLAQEEFIKEAEIFTGLLINTYSVNAKIVSEDADVQILKCIDEQISPEGYILDVTEAGVTLKAGTKGGIFCGCQTLMQLIVNSPDASIYGVNIVDKALMKIRSVRFCWPDKENIQKFKRFVDFLAKYKINRVIVEGVLKGECLTREEMNDLVKYMNARHIEFIPEAQPLSDMQEAQVSIGAKGRCTWSEAVTEKIYEILKMSCISWWGGYKPDHTAVGCLMPDALERIIAQLYPMERDLLEQTVYPSRISKNYKTLNLREFYNAPLYRLSWKPDDYDYMYLPEARNIPNTAPFSLFQGVLDFKLQNALVLTGNDWNQGIYDIPVNMKIRSLVFLHSYIGDKTNKPEQSDSTEENIVGHYEVHYADCTIEKVEVEYGRTVFNWKTDCKSGRGAYSANPVFKGIAYSNIPYTIYSQEWVNFKPDIGIVKIDVIPAENHDDGGIALFGITVVQ